MRHGDECGGSLRGPAGKCPQCGATVDVPAAAGAPPPAAPGAPPGAPAAAPVVASASGQQDPLAIVGFVLGLVALVGSFIPCINWFGFLPAIGGLVCSIIALSNAKKEGRPRGLAMAGLICSSASCAFMCRKKMPPESGFMMATPIPAAAAALMTGASVSLMPRL